MEEVLVVEHQDNVGVHDSAQPERMRTEGMGRRVKEVRREGVERSQAEMVRTRMS